jgi:hypothetical protein
MLDIDTSQLQPPKSRIEVEPQEKTTQTFVKPLKKHHMRQMPPIYHFLPL